MNEEIKKELLPSSPVPLTTLLKKWGKRVKVVLMYWRLKYFVSPLVRYKNRRRKILTYPNKKLFKPSMPITDFSGEGIAKLECLVTTMINTLQKQEWGQKLGIAAPQIGVNKRVFIALGHVFVNPEFTPTKAPPETITEGCYSLDKRLFKVPRAKYGWAKWQDTRGNGFEEKISGLKAIVFQHELDHLNGKSCVENGVEMEQPSEEEIKR